MALADLQQVLRPGEAYYKMIAGRRPGLWPARRRPAGAQAFRIGASAAELDREVDALRATISVEENEPDRHLSVRRRARLRPLPASCSGRSPAELAAVAPPHLRARRGDAAAAAEPARHRPRRRSSPISPRRAGRATTASTSPASPGSAAAATSAPPSRPAPSATSARRRRRRARADYLGLGENAPPRCRGSVRAGGSRPARRRTRPAPGRSRHWTQPISAAELRTGGARDRAARATRASTSSPAGIQRHGDQAPRRSRRLPDHAFRHPRPGDGAAPRMSGAAGADDQFGGAGSDGLLTFGEIYDLQHRRRPRHPLRLRHGRQGEPRRHRARRACDRRRRRARRAGARLRRRRRPFGDRQPLAGARRLSTPPSG